MCIRDRRGGSNKKIWLVVVVDDGINPQLNKFRFRLLPGDVLHCSKLKQLNQVGGYVDWNGCSESISRIVGRSVCN